MNIANPGDLLAAVDIGTHKISAVIGRVESGGTIRVVGFGCHSAEGVNHAAIADLDSATRSVARAVDEAEKMACEQVKTAVVNAPVSQINSTNISATLSVGGRGVTENDLRRLAERINGDLRFKDADKIYSEATGYSIDGTAGITDPRGMFGEKLTLNMNIVTANVWALKNLDTVMDGCHLRASDVLPAAYAAGLATLTGDERQLGATLIDMGAGTTSVAVFVRDALIHAKVFPIGGADLSQHLAKTLSTPLAAAEKMKTLHATLLPSSDDGDPIPVPLIGEEDEAATYVSRADLTALVSPVIEELLNRVRDHLESNDLYDIASRRAVLTGGAAQMTGMKEMVSTLLDKQARLGVPGFLTGMKKDYLNPGLATAAGLLRHAALTRAATDRKRAYRLVKWEKLGKIGRLIAESF